MNKKEKRQIDISQIDALLRRTPLERMRMHDTALAQALELRRGMRKRDERS